MGVDADNGDLGSCRSAEIPGLVRELTLAASTSFSSILPTFHLFVLASGKRSSEILIHPSLLLSLLSPPSEGASNSFRPGYPGVHLGPAITFIL
jgi:hypothetical protein